MEIKTEITPIGGYDGILQATRTLERTVSGWGNSTSQIKKEIEREKIQDVLIEGFRSSLESGYYQIRYQYGNQIEYYYMFYIKGENYAMTERYLPKLREWVDYFKEDIEKCLKEEKNESKGGTSDEM